MVIFLGFSTCGSGKTYKEGDIVFQISRSSQSPFIQYATGPVYSHCGVIVMKDNSPYVLEASNVVKLPPLKQWIKRGRFEKITSIRVLDNDNVKIKYKKYLGKPYDLAFRFDNDKYYCSELVYLIYKRQFGIELCKPKKLKEYNLTGIKGKAKKRGMDMNQLVVAPVDILNTNLKH